MPLGGAARQVGHAPRFVERYPRDDAGMIDVADNGFRPLAHEAIDGSSGESVSARHLLPDEQPQSVCPIKKALSFDLLMFADAVEPHRFRQFNVAAKSVIVRRRQPRIGPIALIEHHA